VPFGNGSSVAQHLNLGAPYWNLGVVHGGVPYADDVQLVDVPYSERIGVHTETVQESVAGSLWVFGNHMQDGTHTPLAVASNGQLDGSFPAEVFSFEKRTKF